VSAVPSHLSDKRGNMLTAEELRSWLAYNPLTGNFHWKRKPNRRIQIGQRAGTPWGGPGSRVQIRLLGKIYRAHRLAWLFVNGEWPDGEIDHIDGDPSNNRIYNLRDVSPQMNRQNQRRPHKGNRSGFLGVSKRGRKYRARIGQRFLGWYETPEEAHQAYVAAKRIYHGGCSI
jgi:hypothetical protein